MTDSQLANTILTVAEVHVAHGRELPPHLVEHLTSIAMSDLPWRIVRRAIDALKSDENPIALSRHASA
jgi:hypothetical protein